MPFDISSVVLVKFLLQTGVKAGLSTGRDVRKEMEAKKRKEEEMFSKVCCDRSYIFIHLNQSITRMFYLRLYFCEAFPLLESMACSESRETGQVNCSSPVPVKNISFIWPPKRLLISYTVHPGVLVHICGFAVQE